MNTDTTMHGCTLTWADPVALLRGSAGRPGLDILRAIVDGSLPQAPISATLGFVLVAADEGMTRFVGTPDERLFNPMGTVHGGWACTLLDSAMGAAVLSTLDAATAYSTAQINVHLTRAITLGSGPLTAEGRVVHRGGRMATAEGKLTDGAGKLFAHATATCALFPRG